MKERIKLGIESKNFNLSNKTKHALFATIHEQSKDITYMSILKCLCVPAMPMTWINLPTLGNMQHTAMPKNNLQERHTIYASGKYERHILN